MKRLLVVADDFGLTPGINEGIAQAFGNGPLTSTSFLANTPHFDASMRLLSSLPGLKVGVHLTLVGGRPVLPARDVPSLAGADGAFRASWKSFLPAWWAGRIRREQVEAEWRAQIRKAREAGLSLAHLDSHQHLHALPGLWTIAARLAVEFGIPRLRRPRETCAPPPGTPWSRRLVRRGLLAFASDSPGPGIVRCCDHFFGIAQTGHLDADSLAGILMRIPPGWSELITHPGREDEELERSYRWGYRWERELEALCSERVREQIHRQGIQLDRV
jgi:predicted glycoside hydrolase/deacetylase ChbG (UPF0249 family)